MKITFFSNKTYIETLKPQLNQIGHFKKRNEQLFQLYRNTFVTYCFIVNHGQ